MTLADIWLRIEALEYRYHACHICDARYSHKDSLKSISEMFMVVLNLLLSIVVTYEPRHEISNNVVCATSKASDQPAHMRSLIRAFASRLHIL